MSECDDFIKSFKTLIAVLEGKTVGEMPPMIRDRLLAGGFNEEKLVLEIPTSKIYNCLGSLVRQRGLA